MNADRGAEAIEEKCEASRTVGSGSLRKEENKMRSTFQFNLNLPLALLPNVSFHGGCEHMKG